VSDSLAGSVERLTIVVGEADHHRHQPVYAEVVARARKLRMAGATVLRGSAGFGATSRRHGEHRLRLSIDQPVAIVVVVDRAERIDTLLAELGDLVGGGLVVREPVEVVHYRGGRRR
jgi:PII-like signaling protein